MCVIPSTITIHSFLPIPSYYNPINIFFLIKFFVFEQSFNRNYLKVVQMDIHYLVLLSTSLLQTNIKSYHRSKYKIIEIN